jgi:hypothetical protein
VITLSDKFILFILYFYALTSDVSKVNHISKRLMFVMQK